MRIEIETPTSFRWDRLYRYWGRDPTSASEKAEQGRLRLGLRLPEGPAVAVVESLPGRLICEVSDDGWMKWEAPGGLKGRDRKAQGEALGSQAHLLCALKGRDLREPAEVAPLQGAEVISPPVPRASPWALRSRPFRPPGAFQFQSRGAGGRGPESATLALRRMLGLELDPSEFEKQVAAGPHARLIAGREGQTVPQVPNVWDGLVWVVAGQQISLAVAFALRRRLTQAVGSRLGEDLWAPPSAAQVAALSPEDLYSLGFSKAKAAYILAAARAVEEGLDLESWRGKDPAEIEAGLLALHGLGPWSAGYLMMRAYGLPDQVPVGDAALVKSLAEFFGLPERPNPKKTRELMAPFAPWRSLATFHFWARLEKQPAD